MQEAAEPPRYEVPAISLRLRHPDACDLGGLLAAWGFDVGRSWQAGDARVTPEGNSLGGTWPQSYAYARLALPEKSLLPAELSRILTRLAGAKSQLAAFVEEGGAAELFVCWRFVANSGDTFDWKLLSALAEYRLNLALDVYPEGERLENG